jgi:hypothetical protein
MTMLQRSATRLAPLPVVHGTHCAGVGCEHDELAGSGFEPLAPTARSTARHRSGRSGRRARVQLASAPASSRSAAHRAG